MYLQPQRLLQLPSGDAQQKAPRAELKFFFTRFLKWAQPAG